MAELPKVAYVIAVPRHPFLLLVLCQIVCVLRSYARAALDSIALLFTIVKGISCPPTAARCSSSHPSIFRLAIFTDFMLLRYWSFLGQFAALRPLLNFLLTVLLLTSPNPHPTFTGGTAR